MHSGKAEQSSGYRYEQAMFVCQVLVKVARVELASKCVKCSAATGSADWNVWHTAMSRRPMLCDFPFSTFWQGTGTTLAFETPIDASLTDPGMDGPEER